MSAFRGKAENICSQRVFRLLTPNGHCITSLALGVRLFNLKYLRCHGDLNASTGFATLANIGACAEGQVGFELRAAGREGGRKHHLPTLTHPTESGKAGQLTDIEIKLGGLHSENALVRFACDFIIFPLISSDFVRGYRIVNTPILFSLLWE
jgi:hypothetical protein